MSYLRSSWYRSLSPSLSPFQRGKSLSRSRSRSRSRDSSDVENPGNNLYVTGLSSRITKGELEKHFASEGKVTDVHLVLDPWTRESRGFGFVTMATMEDANRCIKYLDGSVLEGRVITVEKARRRRGRTPTPGRYLGARTSSALNRSPSYSPYYRGRYSLPGYSPGRDGLYSPRYRRHRSRSYSPYYRRHRSRSYSPYYSRRQRSWSRSPYSRSSRSPIRRRRPSWSPIRRRRRSYSCDSRSYSLECSVSSYYHRRYYRSVSRSMSPSRSPSPATRWGSRRDYSVSVSPRPRRSRRRSHSRSASPVVRRRSSRRSYSRSVSTVPRRRSSRRGYSRSFSPSERRSKRSPSSSCSASPRRRKSKRRYSRESYSHSCSMGSRSVSSSPVGSG